MIKKLTLIHFLLFFILTEVSAQNVDATKRTFKFGKVDLAEFQTKVKGPDSAADAIKLFDVGKGSFDISPTTQQFVYNFTRHVRFKVVNKPAYDLANFQIILYNSAVGSSKENIVSVHGATYNLVDGKIEVSKMTGDAKFSSRLDKTHMQKKFTLPNVKEGSIIEYTYTTVSDFTFALDDWYFQGSYPVKYSALTISIPEYYVYKPLMSGYLPIQRSKPEEVNQGTMQVTRSCYYMEDVPAIKDERFITTLDDYVSKIGFEMMATNFPRSGYKDFSSTWPKLMFELMDEESFGRFIGKPSASKEFLTGAVKNETDSIAKMNLIFNHVKKAAKWDGRLSMYASENSPKAVFDKKSGNSADINLSLLNMLKSAGLVCSPVLLSTRGNGYHPGYPMMSKFNNVVVEVLAGGKSYLLDATDEDNLGGLISYQDLNHEGLKVDVENKSASWISLETPDLSSTNISYSLVLTPENKFTGTMFMSSDHYEGLRRRKTYKSATSESEFLKDLKASKPGLDIVSYKVDNLNRPEEALAETIDVTIEDNVEDAGNLIYFTPMLYEQTKDNPFNLEERNFPVDFAYPFQEVFKSVIQFPEKYVLDKLPKSEAFALPNSDGSFSIQYFVEGNKIAVRSKISINRSLFAPEDYFTLKEFYKNIVRKQAEQIVFKKI